jgi:hypothetical protein
VPAPEAQTREGAGCDGERSRFGHDDECNVLSLVVVVDRELIESHGEACDVVENGIPPTAKNPPS